MQSFDHCLHLVTLSILAIFFFNRWKLFFLRPRLTVYPFIKTVRFVGLTDAITALFYLFFKVHPVQFPLVLGFCITAVSLVSLYWIDKGWRSRELTISTALILGLVQGIALLPGISRLATTYAAARWLGLSPRKAFELSWAIAVPLFAAASAYAGWKLYYMPEYYHVLTGSLPYIGGAGILAYGALCITAYLFYTKRAWWFGIYMIIPLIMALSL